MTVIFCVTCLLIDHSAMYTSETSYEKTYVLNTPLRFQMFFLFKRFKCEICPLFHGSVEDVCPVYLNISQEFPRDVVEHNSIPAVDIVVDGASTVEISFTALASVIHENVIKHVLHGGKRVVVDHCKLWYDWHFCLGLKWFFFVLICLFKGEDSWW